jgi:hypothetical protein
MVINLLNTAPIRYQLKLQSLLTVKYGPLAQLKLLALIKDRPNTPSLQWD